MVKHSVRFSLIFVLGVLLLTGSAMAREFVVGSQTDRSGPLQVVGVFFGDGFADYMKLFNKKQLLGPGNSIRVFEIDMGYNVPRSVEAYYRQKSEGAVSISLLNTGSVKALTPQFAQDQILGSSPGFGSADGANGKDFPFLFPMAASYWSQAGAAMKFLMDTHKGPGKPKIAFIYGDNPAGREPIPVLEKIAEQEGLELRQYAVPAPYLDMRPQIVDIVRRYKADWVISHLFGPSPGLSIKELKRYAFPIDRMIAFVWAAGESHIEAAGWDRAQGYYNMQFAHVGSSAANPNHPVLKEIVDMYKAEGREPPESMNTSVYYNRGVMTAAVHAEAIRLAVEKHGADNVDSVRVKEGMERIRNFSLDGLFSPINMSPEDHEGGGMIRVYQIKGNTYVAASDWFRGYRDVVADMVWKGR
jgi:branched-chain amino acid transport system substrate-binding protein